jgi:hypothetical protein
MNSDGPVFLREVARIDNPIAVAGQAPGHRARRLIDGRNPAFSDPFLLMARRYSWKSAVQNGTYVSRNQTSPTEWSERLCSTTSARVRVG